MEFDETDSAIHKAAVRPAAVQNNLRRSFLPMDTFLFHRNYTRQTSGMAVNREAAGFVNSTVSGPAHGIVTKTVHKSLPGGGYRVTGGGGGLFDMKLTLSVRHNCLKLKMII